MFSPLIAAPVSLAPVGRSVRPVLASPSSPWLAPGRVLGERALSLVGSQMPSHSEQRKFRSIIESCELGPLSFGPGVVPFGVFVPSALPPAVPFGLLVRET